MIAKVGGGGSLLEAAGRDDGCVPRGVVGVGEVISGEVHCHRCIVLVRSLGGDAVICFCMPAQTEGGGLLCWWRRTMVEAEAKREVGANDEEFK